MSAIDDLTPRQQRLGRRAVRFIEVRGAYFLTLGLLSLGGVFLAAMSHRLVARDPAGALWQAGAAGLWIATAAVGLLYAPSVSLLGILYRRLEQASPEDRRAGPRSGAPVNRTDLAQAERRLVESAGQLERLGWGSVRGGILIVLASGIAVIAAALWRFGSGSGGLGTAALAMAATGGLTVGVALGAIVMTRWMRLAARLGAGTSPT